MRCPSSNVTNLDFVSSELVPVVPLRKSFTRSSFTPAASQHYQVSLTGYHISFFLYLCFSGPSNYETLFHLLFSDLFTTLASLKHDQQTDA